MTLWFISKFREFNWLHKREVFETKTIYMDMARNELVANDFYLFLVHLILSGQTNQPPFYNKLIITTLREPDVMIKDLYEALKAFKKTLLYASLDPPHKNIIDNKLSFRKAKIREEKNPYIIYVAPQKGLTHYFLTESATPYTYENSKNILINKAYNA